MILFWARGMMRSVVNEHILPVIPPIDDVIHPILFLDS